MLKLSSLGQGHERRVRSRSVLGGECRVPPGMSTDPHDELVRRHVLIEVEMDRDFASQSCLGDCHVTRPVCEHDVTFVTKRLHRLGEDDRSAQQSRDRRTCQVVTRHLNRSLVTGSSAVIKRKTQELRFAILVSYPNSLGSRRSITPTPDFMDVHVVYRISRL